MNGLQLQCRSLFKQLVFNRSSSLSILNLIGKGKKTHFNRKTRDIVWMQLSKTWFFDSLAGREITARSDNTIFVSPVYRLWLFKRADSLPSCRLFFHIHTHTRNISIQSPQTTYIRTTPAAFNMKKAENRKSYLSTQRCSRIEIISYAQNPKHSET